jgi:hypothetical protein
MPIEPISFDVTEPKRERTSITLDATAQTNFLPITTPNFPS